MKFITDNNLILILIFIVMLLTVIVNAVVLTLVLQRQRSMNNYIRKIFALMQVATITNAKVKNATTNQMNIDGGGGTPPMEVSSEGPNALSNMGI